MFDVMLILFWAAVVFLAYTVVGYPLLLVLVGSLRRREPKRAPIYPTITIVIPAYNEGDRLRRKLENTLTLAYPAEKREIFVVSDASTDHTNDVARSFANRGVQLIVNPVRKGKHFGQMMVRDASTGEIFIFTDAQVELDHHALERIVSNFADPGIGAVSSEDDVITEKAGLGERIYVEIEMWLRRMEARAGSLVNLSGSFFAARRSVTDLWNPEQSSDFFLALNTARHDMRAIVDPECRNRYGTVRTEKAEYQRKVRTIVHGIDILLTRKGLLNPFRYGFFAIQLASHKLFRWLVPFAFLLLFFANLFLWNAGLFYRFALLAQIAGYFAALMALGIPALREFKLLRLAAFFVIGNAATIAAWMKFWEGDTIVTWEPSRRS